MSWHLLLGWVGGTRRDHREGGGGRDLVLDGDNCHCGRGGHQERDHHHSQAGKHAQGQHHHWEPVPARWTGWRVWLVLPFFLLSCCGCCCGWRGTLHYQVLGLDGRGSHLLCSLGLGESLQQHEHKQQRVRVENRRGLGLLPRRSRCGGSARRLVSLRCLRDVLIPLVFLSETLPLHRGPGAGGGGSALALRSIVVHRCGVLLS